MNRSGNGMMKSQKYIGVIDINYRVEDSLDIAINHNSKSNYLDLHPHVVWSAYFCIYADSKRTAATFETVEYSSSSCGT